MATGEYNAAERPPLTIRMAIALGVLAIVVGIVLTDGQVSLGTLIFVAAAMFVLVRRSLAAWSVMVIVSLYTGYAVARDGIDGVGAVVLVLIALSLAALCAPASRRWANR